MNGRMLGENKWAIWGLMCAHYDVRDTLEGYRDKNRQSGDVPNRAGQPTARQGTG